ncbi:MAG TPA: serine/threonine-protein kinase [Actinocrinis sp.]|nr:serine/threonine-protein kinase [Actinocrinis sp.]
MIPGGQGSTLIDGRFELLERLGGGAMGLVWRALDIVLQREVALKEVRPTDPASAEFDPEGARVMRERVLREARALARLHHPNVVTIYHIVDTPQLPHPWLVMELVTGGSLHDRLKQGPLAPPDAARVGRGVLAALRAAHEAGVQHRDVKPANVLLRPDGTPVLTDFGIAAMRESTALTTTGSVIGSPEFIAPERLRGEEGNPASDLWSLGIMIYAAAEGYSPLRRTSTMATLAAVLDEPIPAPVRCGPLLPALNAVLVRDPSARCGYDLFDRLLADAQFGTGQSGQMGGPSPYQQQPTWAPGQGLGGTGGSSSSSGMTNPHGPQRTAAYGVPGSSGMYGAGGTSAIAGAGGTGQMGGTGRSSATNGMGGVGGPGSTNGTGGNGYPGGTGYPTGADYPNGADYPSGAQAAGATMGGAAAPPWTTADTRPGYNDWQGPGELQNGRPRRSPAFVAALVAVPVVGLVGALVWTLSGGSGGTSGSTTQVQGPAASGTAAGAGGQNVLGASSQQPQTTAPAAADTGSAGTDLLTPAGMTALVAQVKSVMGTTKTTDFTVYPDHADGDVVLGKNHNVYDDFDYSNGQAEDDGAGGTLEDGDKTVDLTIFNWSVLPTLITKAEHSFTLNGPPEIYIIIGPDWADDSPTIRVYVTDEYDGGGYITANVKGDVTGKY